MHFPLERVLFISCSYTCFDSKDCLPVFFFLLFLLYFTRVVTLRLSALFQVSPSQESKQEAKRIRLQRDVPLFQTRQSEFSAFHPVDEPLKQFWKLCFKLEKTTECCFKRIKLWAFLLKDLQLTLGNHTRFSI